MRPLLFFLSLLFIIPFTSHSQPPKKGGKDAGKSELSLNGLAFSIHAGAIAANTYSANFYNGAPENENTINRILHSEVYGPRIWDYLTKNNIISANDGDWNSLEIAEYGNMRYNVAVTIGFGFQYNFNSVSGFFGQFSHATLNAKGSFLIPASSQIPSNTGNYFRCGIVGVEKRNGIDLGYLHRFRLSKGLKLTLESGVNMTSIKVDENQIKIGDLEPISILNVWGTNRPPVEGQNSVGYLQNGPSFGFFVTPILSYNISNRYGLDFGLTFQFLNTNLTNYKKLSLQNVFFVRFLFSK